MDNKVKIVASNRVTKPALITMSQGRQSNQVNAVICAIVLILPMDDTATLLRLPI